MRFSDTSQPFFQGDYLSYNLYINFIVDFVESFLYIFTAPAGDINFSQISRVYQIFHGMREAVES